MTETLTSGSGDYWNGDRLCALVCNCILLFMVISPYAMFMDDVTSGYSILHSLIYLLVTTAVLAPFLAHAIKPVASILSNNLVGIVFFIVLEGLFMFDFIMWFTRDNKKYISFTTIEAVYFMLIRLFLGFVTYCRPVLKLTLFSS